MLHFTENVVLHNFFKDFFLKKWLVQKHISLLNNRGAHGRSVERFIQNR